MSKNMSAAVAAKEQEEEWEDADEEGEEGEEEEDTTINNSDVVVKYKKAALWANETLQVVINAAKPGAKIADLCKLGDDTINAKVATMFRSVADKGVGFPTCVSVNACVAHNSPAVGEDATVLAVGDVARIDLAVQVDGYCAQVAHTLHITESGELAADSREAALIAAGYAVLNTALRKVRPGAGAYEVTEVIERAAAHFGLTPVDGVLSHLQKRYIIDGFRCIPGKKVPEHLVHDYEIEPAQVWALDIVLSTNKNGKLRERDARPGVFKVALDSQYVPKMDSARELQKEIEAKFQTFPFAVRALETKKARLGLSEMAKHGVVAPYPVLYEKDGEIVVHFKVTLLVSAKKIERVTGLPPQKGLPAVAPFTDELLLATSKLSLSLEEKKKKPAAAAASA